MDAAEAAQLDVDEDDAALANEIRASIAEDDPRASAHCERQWNCAARARPHALADRVQSGYLANWPTASSSRSAASRPFRCASGPSSS